MRVTGQTTTFRGNDHVDYPLINLIVTEDDGNRDIATIELGRPEAGGAINERVQTTLDSSWNLENLYPVALVHRDGKLGGKRMHVFNTAMGEITEATGIGEIQNAKSTISNDIYDLSGRKVMSDKMSKGIYIINGKKVIR